MKKHKLSDIFAVIFITLFTLTFVALINIFVLFLYDIKTPIVISCIVASGLAISTILLGIIYVNSKED